MTIQQFINILRRCKGFFDIYFDDSNDGQELEIDGGLNIKKLKEELKQWERNKPYTIVNKKFSDGKYYDFKVWDGGMITFDKPIDWTNIFMKQLKQFCKDNKIKLK